MLQVLEKRGKHDSVLLVYDLPLTELAYLEISHLEGSPDISGTLKKGLYYPGRRLFAPLIFLLL